MVGLGPIGLAAAQVRSARSSLLPQINTQVGYTKTIRSVFQGAGFEIPDSLRFEPDSLAALAERVAYLERNTPNAAFGALGSLFGNLPFGRENAWLAAADRVIIPQQCEFLATRGLTLLLKTLENKVGALRDRLRTGARRWHTALGTARELSAPELNGVIASIAHLAYHLGAIRQMNPTLRGPKAND